jgi:hypothetical protein
LDAPGASSAETDVETSTNVAPIANRTKRQLGFTDSFTITSRQKTLGAKMYGRSAPVKVPATQPPANE